MLQKRFRHIAVGGLLNAEQMSMVALYEAADIACFNYPHQNARVQVGTPSSFGTLHLQWSCEIKFNRQQKFQRLQTSLS